MNPSNFTNIKTELEEIECKYFAKTSKKQLFDLHLSRRIIQLEEELSSLGIADSEITESKSKTKTLEKIVDNSFKLIHMCRKLSNEIHEMKTSQIMLKNENYKLNLCLAKSKTDIEEKSKELNDLQREMRKLHYDISSAKQNNKDLEKQVKTFRTYCQNKEDEYHHKIDKMKQEVDDWQEKCGLHVGKHVSRDEGILHTMNAYKTKELIYQNTIRKLQNNNQELLEKIVDLQKTLDTYVASNAQVFVT